MLFKSLLCCLLLLTPLSCIRHLQAKNIQTHDKTSQWYEPQRKPWTLKTRQHLRRVASALAEASGSETRSPQTQPSRPPKLPQRWMQSCFSKAQYHLTNYQFDSASYYYQSSIDHFGESQNAYIGLTRVSIMLLDIRQATSYHQQAVHSTPPPTTDSLKYAYQLNEALIEVLTTYSTEKLVSFITKTPYEVHDLLLAYEWYIELLIDEKEFSAARQALDEAYSLLKYYPENIAEKFRCCYLLQEANLLFTSSKIKQSINFYESQIFPALADNQATWAKYLLAETYRLSAIQLESLRKYDMALDRHHQYLKLIKGYHADDYFRYGEEYQAIANIYQQLGFYSLSDKYAVKATEVNMSQAPQNELFFARLCYSEGLMYFRQLQYQEALEKFAKVVAVESDDIYIKLYKVEAMLQQIKLYSKLKEYQRSKKTHAQLMAYLDNYKGRRKESHIFRAEYANLQALKASELRQPVAESYEELVNLIQKNVRIRRTTYLSFMNDLTQFLISSNQFDSALSVTNLTLNRYANRLENPDQSFISNELNFLIKTGFLKAEILRKMSFNGNKQERLAKMLACYDRAISWHLLTRQGSRSLSDELYSETSITELFENAIQCAYDLFEATGDASYVARAFQYSETSKSHQLFESLRRNLLIRNSNISDSLILELRSLRTQTSFLKSEVRKLSLKSLLSSKDSILMADYQDLLLEGSEQNRQLMTYLENNYHNYYQVNFGQPYVALSTVQQQLNPKEGLLEYFQGDRHIYSFAITKDTVILNQLATLDETAISNYRNILIPDSTEFNIDDAFTRFLQESKLLYDKLLAPSLRKMGAIQKLYVVPDKLLFFLPIEQLLDEEVTDTDFGSLPYLIRRYQISYGYSASILFQPDVMGKDHFSGRLLAFAPSYDDIFVDSKKANRQLGFGDRLAKLKYNQDEVAGLSDYFSGSTFTGKKATEQQFYQSVKDYDILHFAMHGLLDLEEPQYSRLVFSPDPRDSVNDNFLYNFEIYNLNIPAQLVVLSACNTGVGKLIGGEGAMSLSRAFTYAGVQSVVMTQWPAEDQSSSIIMKSFYQRLGDGLAKDEALRLAKLEYLETAHPFKKNPYYWNNFIISGKMQPVVTTKSGSYLWWAAIVLAFLILFISYRLRRKTT